VAAGGPEFLDLPGFEATGIQFCTVAGSSIPCDFAPPGSPIDVTATRASAAIEPSNDQRFLKNTAISPDTRYTFTLFTGYDLTPHHHIYGSVLLNQRDSSQNLVDQFFVVPLRPSNPFNTALGFNPGTGCFGFCFPVPVIMQGAASSQKVDYARGVLGSKATCRAGAR
jgi:hypothetical protein